jgi:hypothetical protein
MKGIEEIARRGIKIKAIIYDGRKGLVKLFDIKTPVQMCNFHQVATVRRYLTKKPKMQVSKELWVHALFLKQTDKESFEGGLQAWFIKSQDFLNDRKTHEMGRKDM